MSEDWSSRSTVGPSVTSAGTVSQVTEFLVGQGAILAMTLLTDRTISPVNREVLTDVSSLAVGVA